MIALADPLLHIPELLDVAFHESILKIAANFLGCVPPLYRVTVVRDFPHNRPLHSSNFHKDNDESDSLQIFIYLVDIDDARGPLVYVPGSNHYDVRSCRPRLSRDLGIDANDGRLSDEEVERVYPRSAWAPCAPVAAASRPFMAMASTRARHGHAPAIHTTSREPPSSSTCMATKPGSCATEKKIASATDFERMSELQRLFAHATIVEDEVHRWRKGRLGHKRMHIQATASRAATLLARNPALFCRMMLAKLNTARPMPPLPARRRIGDIVFEYDSADYRGTAPMYFGSYAPLVVDAMKRYLRPGGIFFDVGANIGYLSAVAADMVGPAGRCIPSSRCRRISKGFAGSRSSIRNIASLRIPARQAKYPAHARSILHEKPGRTRWFHPTNGARNPRQSKCRSCASIHTSSQINRPCRSDQD